MALAPQPGQALPSLAGGAPGAAAELRLHQVQPLFAAPLAMCTVSPCEVLNAQLADEALQRRAASPGVARSNFGGWHSEDDFFQRNEPGALALRQHIVDALLRMTAESGGRFDPQTMGLQAQGWINVHEAGAMNTPHDHPGWLWSGCYYVQVDEPDDGSAAGAIEFLDPRTNLRAVPLDGASWQAGKYQVRPKAGQMLVFPSWLRHWVYPHRGVRLRISIAFNARIVPSLA